MLKTRFILFFSICCACLSAAAPTPSIRKLVSGNTFKGHFSNSSKSFSLYFSPDKTVYIKKEGMSEYTRYGKWSIQGKYLVTPWPVHDLKTSSSGKMNFYEQRDLKTYKLVFKPMGDHVYEPYKPRACSCDSSPPQAFPKCTWVEGKS